MTVKYRELVKQLEQLGYILVRHGGNHDVFLNGLTEISVPRHREIDEVTAKQILRKAERNKDE